MWTRPAARWGGGGEGVGGRGRPCGAVGWAGEAGRAWVGVKGVGGLSRVCRGCVVQGVSRVCHGVGAHVRAEVLQLG